MRLPGVVLVVRCWAAGACGGGFFRQYEYEEEMSLSLDGSATIYVNSSVSALDALRGATFDPGPMAPFDRTAFLDYFESSVARVNYVRSSRRNNRRFVHVQLEVDDVRCLSEAPPFAWSSYHWNGTAISCGIVRLWARWQATARKTGSTTPIGRARSSWLFAFTSLYRTLWLFGATIGGRRQFRGDSLAGHFKRERSQKPVLTHLPSSESEHEVQANRAAAGFADGGNREVHVRRRLS